LSSINIVADTNDVEIIFEDGTTARFDGVIGADGIFSSVRSYVLQNEADKYAATPAGFWDCRNLVPIAKAKAVLGEDLFAVDRQYGWVGDGAFLMHDVLENRTVVQCVISGVEQSPTKERKRPLNRQILTQTLVNWLDGPIAKGMIEVGTCLETDERHELRLTLACP
jgi:salicylate hydroxylase